MQRTFDVNIRGLVPLITPRDLETARTFAMQSLTLQATPARQHAITHRLARLDRKLGSTRPSSTTSAALF